MEYRIVKNWLVFLTASLLALFVSGCGSSRYTSENTGVGISMSSGEIDLSEMLDVSKLPALVQSAWEEGLQTKQTKEELQKIVLQKISEKVQAISTVDLNADGNSDPVLVIPDGDEEQMTYSFRVPDPKDVLEYPPLSDAKAWQEISENKSVELASVSVIPRAVNGKVEKMDVEARPSSGFYLNQPYYTSSFTSNLLTYMIVRDLFFRPMWFGPSYYGWYGSHYRPMSTSHVASTRTVTNYSSGSSSWNRAKTDSGKIPSTSKGSELASQKSFSAAKDMRAKAPASGGFGNKSAQTASGSRAPASGGFGRSSSSSSSSRGWFSSKSSGGGFRGGK